MITNVSLTTIYCTDQDATRDFYVDKLGFETRADVSMEGFRWVTVGHPNQPELEITLMKPGPPLDDEAAEYLTMFLRYLDDENSAKLPEPAASLDDRFR